MTHTVVLRRTALVVPAGGGARVAQQVATKEELQEVLNHFGSPTVRRGDDAWEVDFDLESAAVALHDFAEAAGFVAHIA